MSDEGVRETVATFAVGGESGAPRAARERVAQGCGGARVKRATMSACMGAVPCRVAPLTPLCSDTTESSAAEEKALRRHGDGTEKDASASIAAASPISFSWDQSVGVMSPSMSALCRRGALEHQSGVGDPGYGAVADNHSADPHLDGDAGVAEETAVRAFNCGHTRGHERTRKWTHVRGGNNGGRM